MPALPLATAECCAGWQGRLALRFVRAHDRTRLRREAGYGPLYVQKPFYPEDDLPHVYLLHPPGGIAGGDSLDVTVTAEADTAALLTTPAASKFYRSSGLDARLAQTLSVARGACLEWLPQETLFFGGCQAALATHVHLAAGARFLGWEIYCLGREAAGDHFEHGEVVAGIRITRGEGGQPLPTDAVVLRERLQLQAGDGMLDAPWGLAGRRVLATLYATPADADVLRLFRKKHPARVRSDDVLAAATLIDDVLVYRVLGYRSEAVTRDLLAVWRTLRPLVAGRTACPPRIWNT